MPPTALLVALVLVVPALAADPLYCVYPISGSYGLLPRCLFYVSLACALGLRLQWIVVGSLLSVMTFAGTGALHAAVLLAAEPLDLDAVALRALLATALLCFAPILCWSPNLRSNRGAQRIFQLWGVLASVGVFCAAAAAESAAPEAVCAAGACSCPAPRLGTRRAGDVLLATRAALDGSAQHAVRLYTISAAAVATLTMLLAALLRPARRRKVGREARRVQRSLSGPQQFSARERIVGPQRQRGLGAAQGGPVGPQVRRSGEGQTQLFIETPYRNAALLQALLQTLQHNTWLAVSSGLTLPVQAIVSDSAKG